MISICQYSYPHLFHNTMHFTVNGSMVEYYYPERSIWYFIRVIIISMKKNSIRTTKDIAKKASSLLRDQRVSQKTKSVAGSAIVNRKKK